MKEKQNDKCSIKGKWIAITGCTGGLGTCLCHQLAQLGANLIMIDRNINKSERLKHKLLREFADIEIFLVTADLENFSSVKKALEVIKTRRPDVFINNAGAYSIPRKICETGFDNVFQINFVSPYYITRELLQNNPQMKVVIVGSLAHQFSKLNRNDVDLKKKKSASKVYGNSKRFLMISLHNYVRENGGKLSIVHPGISFTNITSNYLKWLLTIIKYPMKLIFMKPSKAVLSIEEGVFINTPYGYWIGPRYFEIWGEPKMRKLKACFSKDSEQIAQISEEIYKNLRVV